jgi:nucleoside 2-deoxyribosyltransferase
MKIYFGFTVAGERSSIDAAKMIVEMLERNGHVVLTRHLVQDDAWSADRMMAPRAVYERDMRWLEECDYLIAEVSGSSFGIGFEAGYLLGSTKKQVLLIYRREAEKRISLLITGNAHPRCTVMAYSELGEVQAFISSRFIARKAPL